MRVRVKSQPDHLVMGTSLLCNVCGQDEAIFFRPYSGERPCRSCFIHSIEKHVRKTISKYGMFREDDRIAVAVSGGKDSLSLLNILSRIEKKFPKAELFAVTVDEGIRGYRDEALRNADEACKQFGVEHTTVSFKELYGCTVDSIAEKIADRKGELTACSYCGVLRRKALNKAARELGATKIATAHTLDDEAQTILLNFIHGDVFRASRIEPKSGDRTGKFVQRVKPFCEIPEDEITLYAFLRDIKFQSINCPYAPSAMRTEIRDFLNRLEADHPGTKFVVYRSFQKIRPLLKPIVKPEINECRICGEPTAKTICESCSIISKLGILKSVEEFKET